MLILKNFLHHSVLDLGLKENTICQLPIISRGLTCFQRSGCGHTTFLFLCARWLLGVKPTGSWEGEGTQPEATIALAVERQSC